jgi:pyruvate/2-oxoglutarate/acetoin dehydrogenase E1 component
MNSIMLMSFIASSVFTYGSLVPTVPEAASKASELGVDVEVVDLRSLAPPDIESVLCSIKKTGRAVVVYEAPKTMGYGAEISAILAEEALDYLKAPVVRVGGFGNPFPYLHENLYLPTVPRILKAIQRVAQH